MQLIAAGFREIPVCTEFESSRLKGKGTVVIYKTGTMLVQGSDAEIRQIQNMLKGKETHETLVGTDESLKGDTFGGIVVAGVRADKEERGRLQGLGVMDSKLLSDSQIVRLAHSIIDGFAWHAESLLPKDYNTLVEGIGVTGLLNRLHAACNLKLKTKGSKHVVDKYPGCAVGDIALTKAESQFVEVAAASILARHFALEQIRLLSNRAGFQIPLGSTHVASALEKLKTGGLQFEAFVKMGFQNVQKVYKPLASKH
jgi:ribonuclease HIII